MFTCKLFEISFQFLYLHQTLKNYMNDRWKRSCSSFPLFHFNFLAGFSKYSNICSWFIEIIISLHLLSYTLHGNMLRDCDELSEGQLSFCVSTFPLNRSFSFSLSVLVPHTVDVMRHQMRSCVFIKNKMCVPLICVKNRNKYMNCNDIHVLYTTHYIMCLWNKRVTVRPNDLSSTCSWLDFWFEFYL